MIISGDVSTLLKGLEGANATKESLIGLPIRDESGAIIGTVIKVDGDIWTGEVNDDDKYRTGQSSVSIEIPKKERKALEDRLTIGVIFPENGGINTMAIGRVNKDGGFDLLNLITGEEAVEVYNYLTTFKKSAPEKIYEPDHVAVGSTIRVYPDTTTTIITDVIKLEEGALDKYGVKTSDGRFLYPGEFEVVVEAIKDENI